MQADNEQMIVLLNDLMGRLADIIMKRQAEKRELNDEADNGREDLDVATEYLCDNCSKWGKVQELLFLLENSLKTIEERWLNVASGMSKQISASEVRNMIKALFKNSNLRSKILEKIV